MKIPNLLEQTILRVGKHLKKAKEKMDINKGKEKMVMERAVIIIKSDTSYDYFPFQATSDESSDHNPFQATSNENSNHNPFQATFNESSDYNRFQVSSDDTLKSRSKDTYSSDSTWEQKKLLNVKDKQEKDKIGTKPDKNEKRGKARQCQIPVTINKAEKRRKYKFKGPKMETLKLY
nr:hypothetical protein [Tanacetum cinerariifolium]